MNARSSTKLGRVFLGQGFIVERDLLLEGGNALAVFFLFLRLAQLGSVPEGWAQLVCVTSVSTAIASHPGSPISLVPIGGR